MANWYYVAEGQRKGPFSEEEFRGLVQGGVVAADSLVWTSSMPDWKPWREVSHMLPAAASEAPAAAPGEAAVPGTGPTVLTCAACGGSFPAEQIIPLEGRNICANCKPAIVQRMQEGQSSYGSRFAGSPDELIAAIRGQGYDAPIGDCVSRAWDCLRPHLWTTIGVILLVGVCAMAASLLTACLNQIVPMAGSVVSILVTGPLYGGLSWFALKVVRNQNPQVSDAFTGFQNQRMWPLVLLQLVPTLVILPFAILIGMVVALTAAGRVPVAIPVVLGGLVAVAFMVGYTYLMVSWIFGTYLVFDMGYTFRQAVRVSWRVVQLHWWRVFWYLFVMGWLYFVGIFACGVGLLFTGALALIAIAVLYDRIFGGMRAGAAPPA